MKILSDREIFRYLTVQGIGWYTCGNILLSAITISIPWLLGLFVDQIVAGGNIGFIFSILFGLAFLKILLDFILNIQLFRISRHQEVNLQTRLLDRFCQMNPDAIDQYHSGEIGMKFFRDVPTVCLVIRDFYPQMLSAITGIIFALCLVFYSNWLIGIIFTGVLPIQILVLSPYRKKFPKFNHLYRILSDRTFNRIFEFFHIFPFLKSLGAEEPFKIVPQTKFKTLAKFSLKKDVFNTLFYTSIAILAFVGEYAVLGTAGYLAWKGQIPVGHIVFYQGLFLTVLNSFSGFFRILPLWENIQESLTSIQEILQCKSLENEIPNRSHSPISGAIEIQAVTCRYKNRERNILENFTTSISVGDLVAIKGKNGVGKTTLLKLLTGYMKPVCGKICFDGIPLDELDIKTFRQQIGVVFQEYLLITGTLRQNITLGNPKYSESDIQEAVRLSGFNEVLKRLPMGLDHRIGFDSSGLSGGECQKLAISRALIRKPKILVLDEVTNHLDWDSRLKIRELLKSLHGKTTILLVSHDMDILNLCDKTICLE